MALTKEQLEHQAWINNQASGQGGMDNYIKTQQQKFNTALTNKDDDMINKLNLVNGLIIMLSAHSHIL